MIISNAEIWAESSNPSPGNIVVFVYDDGDLQIVEVTDKVDVLDGNLNALSNKALGFKTIIEKCSKDVLLFLDVKAEELK